MRIRPALLLAVLASHAGASFAVTPPKYLSVRDFRQCLASEPHDSYRTWCLPAQQPQQCSDDSWQQLQALQGDDRVAACAAGDPLPRLP